MESPDNSQLRSAVCDRFEAAWTSAVSADLRPRIQDFLKTIPETENTELFCSLLARELKCRRQDNELPTVEEYHQRFPEFAHLIPSVFEKSGFEPDFRTTLPYTPRPQPEPDFAEGPPAPTPGKTARRDSNGKGKIGSGSTLVHAPAVSLSSPPSVTGFEILGVLGRGGMGIVYKARDVDLKRLVALKMIRPDQVISHDALMLFRAEAEAVARFQHPNVVQIFRVGEHDGRPYLSLEFVDGGNLHQKLDGAPQPAAQAAALVETLAKAVAEAHKKNIVHRDLKPSNILLTIEGTPKVGDFGLAKHLDHQLDPSDDERIVGTPSYMAPEQTVGRGVVVGPAADIYALGVILYEMLTGRPPFKTVDREQTFQLVRNQEPVPPRKLVPQVPRDLELICLKCLEKDPEKRFATAQALAAELRLFQEGRPITTRPAPWWERVWKWSRRKPAAASLIAVSIFALLSLVLFLEQRARLAEGELFEQQRTSQLRSEAQQLLLQAEKATAEGRLQNARDDLKKAGGIIQAEAALADLHDLAEALAKEVLRQEVEQARQEKQRRDQEAAQRADLTRKIAERKKRDETEAAQRRFFKHRDDALFHGMVYAGVDLAKNLKVTVENCQAALTLYDATVRDFSAYLTPKQVQELTTTCYELLLVWAEAVAQPLPGRPAAAQLAEEALELLNRAERLNLQLTATYHLRRASYLDVLPGKADAARKARDRAAAAPPLEALDFFLNGVTLQKEEKLKEAADFFVKALNADEGHFWARYYLAVVNLQMQMPAQARDNFSTCLISRKEFLHLYLYRGFAHGLLNDFPSAEEDFKQALALKPDAQALYGIRVNQGVLRLRQASLVEGVVPFWPFSVTAPVDFLWRGVTEACRLERLAAAKALLKIAITVQPAQYPAYRYLAVVAQQQKRLNEAAEHLDKAITFAAEQKPAVLAQLYGQRARVHRDKSDLKAALDDLNQALAAFPSAEDYRERGRILYFRQQHKQALADYEFALNLRPDQADVYRWKAEALLALHREAKGSKPADIRARKDLESEVVKALTHYLAKGGRPSAEVYRIRGQIRVWHGQFQEALADYTKALALEPHSATFAARGWVFLANESKNLALEDFENALLHDAKNAEAYAGRGLIRVRLGQDTHARADADTAFLVGPPTFRLLWNIAHIYAQLIVHLDSQPGAQTIRASLARTALQDKGLEMLRGAFEKVPAQERSYYWQTYITSDGLLNSLRIRAEFKELERKYKGGD